MIIRDEQTGFWCHSLQMNASESIRYQPKGKIEYNSFIKRFERMLALIIILEFGRVYLKLIML